MNSFINYIIEAGISLGVFTLIYWFILRGETRFKATRFYLLFALVFSTVLPFLTIRLNLTSALTLEAAGKGTFLWGYPLESVTVYAAGIPSKMGQALLSFDYSMLIYQLGAIAAFFVIALGIFQLMLMVTKNRVFRLKGTRLVVSKKEISPYSFFNFIFIGRKLTEQKNWKTIVQHELEHVKQGHSFDVLFVDMMMIFQWFNPFYWMLRRLVRENHEFLADTGVLSKGQISGARYKELLLSQAIGGHPVMTSNFLNVKFIQKRFKMITKNTNKKYGFLRYSAGVLIALMLTLAFACEDFDRSDGKTDEGDFIYNGEFTTYETVRGLEINYLNLVTADKIDVIMLYPELKGKLDKEKYQLAFNTDDPVQKELFSKLEVKLLDANPNNISELVVVGYGIGKTLADEEETFIIVEDMPEFPGGELALRKWLGTHVKYPTIAAENGIMGKVYVTFVVGKDGSIYNARIARGVDPSLDQEALRVINTLPAWKPGHQRGIPVNVSYTVPINFQLQ
ncbi:MAG: TonB family protein [Prolixibacteraceae bacterium]